ncbi:MAG TPA: radical SAM family heme chaperone HemW [Thermoanaerobaculia bacterium]
MSPERAGEPAGIYVHLPYCRSRCGYCAFVVTTDVSARAEYFSALAREIQILRTEAEGARFDSIYLGGGTPSFVSTEEMASLLGSLHRSFGIVPSAEVTIEANPDDVGPDSGETWASLGVNRISLGVQSLIDSELAAVGRRHDASGARRALENLARTGLSLSADLILGLPGQTAESFAESVEEICRYGVTHLSVYLLETEKSKTIEEDRRQHPERYLSDDEQADAWLALGERLGRAELGHYEVSNWAIPGREARHNLKYWRRVPTLGLGVSAHELWRGRRRANVSALPGYLTALAEGRRPVALDNPIDEDEAAREEIVLGLRLSEGVPWSEIQSWLASHPDPALEEDLESWQEAGLLTRHDGRLRLTERGFLVSNEILCRFV